MVGSNTLNLTSIIFMSPKTRMLNLKWRSNWIALQRKSASPVEIHAVFCCLRHNGLEQYTSSFFKTIRTDATLNFTCVLGSITKLEFYTRTLRHFKNDDYQNGLADFLCKAIQLVSCEEKLHKHMYADVHRLVKRYYTSRVEAKRVSCIVVCWSIIWVLYIR